MYRAALIDERDAVGNGGKLPYRILLNELRDQEKIEHNRERKETLQTLILLTIGIIELQQKAEDIGVLIEKLIP